MAAIQTSWVVQTNVERESPSPGLLRAACDALGLPFYGVSVVRGSTSLPDLPNIEGPVVFHGRATLIRIAMAHPHWSSGVYFSTERFTHTAYVEAYGADMLNAGARVLSLAELGAEAWPADAKLFVRPNDDSKRFPGQVTTLSDLAGSGLDPSTQLVVDEVKDGEIIDWPR